MGPISKKRTRVPDVDVNVSKSVLDKASSEPAPNGFASAMSKILSRELHVKNPKAGPVLAKRHTAAEKAAAIERAALVAARARTAAKRAAAALRNVAPSARTLDAERALRRVATAGVVALFNAITRHQRGVEAVIDEPTSRKKSRVIKAVAEKQQTFIELLRGGVSTSAGGAATTTTTTVTQAWLVDGFVEASGTKGGRAAEARADLRRQEPGLLDAEEF
jgi:hypothetical protein